MANVNRNFLNRKKRLKRRRREVARFIENCAASNRAALERGEPTKAMIVDRRPQRAGATREFIGYLQATYRLTYLDGHPIKKDPPYKEPAAWPKRAQHQVCCRSAFHSAPAYRPRTNHAEIANRLRSQP